MGIVFPFLTYVSLGVIGHAVPSFQLRLQVNQCEAKLAAVRKSRGCYTFPNDPSKKLCAHCEAKRADRVDGIKKVNAAALRLGLMRYSKIPLYRQKAA